MKKELASRFLDEDVPVLAPVSEVHHTQLGPGSPFMKGSIGFLTRQIVLGRISFEPRFIGRTVPNPSLVVFLVPIRWRDRYYFNGAPVAETSLCVSSGSEGFFTRGEDSEVIDVGIPRTQLVATLAALHGVEPGVLELPNGVLNLSPRVARALRERLAAAVPRVENTDSASAAARLATSEDVLGVLLEAVLQGTRAPMQRDRDETDILIARRAEERFMQSGPTPPSLADLCAAAGVGKNRLYQAFRSLYDETPVAYFHKRRLSSARRMFVREQPARGTVKRVALDYGFTELGRFSVDYRRLFGEHPSTTLNTPTYFT